MNQSELEANTRNWRQARENACEWVGIIFEFYFWLVEKVAPRFLTNHRVKKSKTNAKHELLSTVKWKPLYVPKQWIVFFACSDWLLVLGSIWYSPPNLVLIFAREFFLISQTKRNCLVLSIHWFTPRWIIVLVFTSSSVNNCQLSVECICHNK